MIAIPPLSSVSASSQLRPISQERIPSPAVSVPKDGGSPSASMTNNQLSKSDTVAPGYPSPDYHYDTLTGQMVMQFLNAKSGAPELQIPDTATLRERAASIASYRPADPEPK